LRFYRSQAENLKQRSGGVPFKAAHLGAFNPTRKSADSDFFGHIRPTKPRQATHLRFPHNLALSYGKNEIHKGEYYVDEESPY